MNPDEAVVACRAIHDTAVMLLWGTFAYLAALVPVRLALATERRLTWAIRIAGVAAIISTVMTLPLETSRIGEGWGDAFDPATLRAVLFETGIGWAWAVQTVLAVLLAAAFFAPPKRRQVALAVASGLLLASLSLTGHSAMQEGWIGIAHRANDSLHVLAGGAWLGALLPFLPILRALDDPASRPAASVALHRFSTAGHAAVALVLLTGIVNAWLVLGRWPDDWRGPYQALLAAKMALVALMICLALLNRYAVVPWMIKDRRGALQTLRSVTLVELVLGLIVIGLVSVFGTLEPA